MATEPFSHYMKFSEIARKVDGPVHLMAIIVGGSLLLFEGGRIGIKKLKSMAKNSQEDECAEPQDQIVDFEQEEGAL